jgi:DNA polymerase-3 subunit gamma/tau
LQFNLKQMPSDAIAAHLAELLRAEQVPGEADALQLIGRAAAGSMRDALSLLDQAIAHGAGSVTAQGVRDMLGTVDEGHLLRLLDAVAAGDGPQVLQIADEMQAHSLSFDAALRDVAHLLLQVTILQVASEAPDTDAPHRQEIAALAQSVDPEHVQLCYQIALQGREDLPLAPDEHAGFVMTMLRMLAFRPERLPAETKIPEARGAAARRAEAPAARPPQGFTGDWPALVQQLAVTGAARELARNAALARHADGVFELVVPVSMRHLGDRGYAEKLRLALEQHLGGKVSLRVTTGAATGATVADLESQRREARQTEAERAVQGDRFVRDLVDMFDAKVVEARARARDDGA